MLHRLFGLICALCGALAMLAIMQRFEIETLKMVLTQMPPGYDATEAELYEQG